jgi:phosphoglycerate kinase
MDKGAKVVVISHFGRPEGKGDMKNSLSHIVKDLEKALGKHVVFVDDCIGSSVEAAVKNMKSDEVLLLENLRFYDEEKKGDENFAKELVKPADVYVSDAFSTAHRAHASMVAAAKLLPSAMGLLMAEEVNALSTGLNNPVRPLIAIVGGSKVSTKLDLLNNLVKKVDKLVISGGMAHTFMKASGLDTINEKNSLVQMDMLDTAKEIMATAKSNNCEIVLPLDVVISKEFKPMAEHRTVDLDNIPAEGWELLDVGEKTIASINAKLDACKTLVWNGPLGVFEMKPFDNATNKVAQHAAELTQAGKLTSVAGGGDTVSALENAGVANKFTYISTAGGAFLEWMEGKELPGVAVMKK